MLDRKTPPLFQKSNSFALITPEKITLANGIVITVVPGGEQEVTKIEFIFRAGKWQESQPGVSYFTTQLLQKGTANKNSFQISSELDQHGMHLEVSPGFDFTSLTLYGLTKNMVRFIDLIHAVITEPSFPEQELQQAKDIYVQGLKINLEKTSFLASRQLRNSLFGKDHPYGRDAEVNDISKIQQSQLVSFHQQYFKDVEIICSGKVQRDLIDALAGQFGSLPVSRQAPLAIRQHAPGIEPTFLEKENSIQSSIRLGKLVIARTHADYPALLLLNHILGGYFGSRLMKNIREEKGLTYGIYASITALKHAGFLSIGADVNKENRGLTITEIKNELRKLRTEAVSSDELETAKNHFIGSLQAEITTSFAHADKIKNILLYSLPADFYQTLLNRLDALREADVLETARKYFDEETFTVVAAG